MSKVHGIPPTDGIPDPQTRAWADAFVNAWALRNGQIGANEQERFVTLKEFQGLTEQSLSAAFGVSNGIPGVGTGTNNGNRIPTKRMQRAPRWIRPSLAMQ